MLYDIELDASKRTLRDQFAMAVLPACYEEFFAGNRAGNYSAPCDWGDRIANDAYAMADAMIKVRNDE